MSASGGRTDGGLSGAGEARGSCTSLNLRPFKLRFAPQRQLGRSYVSAIKPMGMPTVIEDKFHRHETDDELQGERVEKALRRVRDMFQRGPRDKFQRPVTVAHEYGWWWDCGQVEPLVGGRKMQHYIHDSAWLKERVRVLANDAGFKRV